MHAAASVPSALVDEVISTRRYLHRYPELAFEEHRTAQLVSERLHRLGFEVHREIGRTGVVGIMRGSRPGRTIMLRADMDALPLTEETDASYRSTYEGKMHACGHDGHVAILLGAAALIADLHADLAGTVCLLFQPAEETGDGAKTMLEEAVIERFGIERAYGLHLLAMLPTGVLGFREGPLMASADLLEIEINGTGGHGSMPHLAIDPICAAGNFIASVQQVVSRQIDPLEAAVVTIGAIHGGTVHNIIPRNCSMLGTVRTFSEETRKQMPPRIERVLQASCLAAGAEYRYEYIQGVPVTVNDNGQTQYARSLAQRLFGEERVVVPNMVMGAEDFSLYAQRVPSCFFFLGSRGGPSSSHPHHSSYFDIDEDALKTGVAMMAALARDAPLL